MAAVKTVVELVGYMHCVHVQNGCNRVRRRRCKTRDDGWMVRRVGVVARAERNGLQTVSVGGGDGRKVRKGLVKTLDVRIVLRLGLGLGGGGLRRRGCGCSFWFGCFLQAIFQTCSSRSEGTR